MAATERRFEHLTVRPYDSPLRMTVTSKSRPDIEHLVDLGSLRGNGVCSCEHFQFRLLPELKTGAKIKRCQHILAARAALVDIVIRKLTDHSQ